ncbi:hypothetical protein HC031_11665 [Planosporangium thailandense]|uniref:Secreted protein n=1 Tax=Planosporangium thailandense TaxID=765197 RepID=A0ABX0XWD1_9ACTN|nr:hypothetical protein [Planosporangium thailandense]NJC70363.1 hypothetical protein [Planosporangium thailandense]
MLSTYVTWILVLIALGAGAWVLLRPGGGARSKASGGAEPTPPTPPPPEQPLPPQQMSAPPRTTPLHAVTTQRPPDDLTSNRLGSEPPNVRPYGGQSFGDMPPMPPLGMWSDGYAQSVRERWRDLQLRFIDNPNEVANEAERVVEETVEALTTSLNAFKSDLDAWRHGPGDTEQLRAAVHRYRDFLDRLLGS